MGWFNKDEEVPQIAPAPILPELPKKKESMKKDLPELPTFPNTSKSENFNQEMVKSAVGDIPSSEEKKVNVGSQQGESLIPPRLSEKTQEPPKHTTTLNKTEEYKTVHDPSWYSEQNESPKEISKVSLPPVPKKNILNFNTISDNNPASRSDNNPIPRSDNNPIPKRVEPIFVRIDKFQLAQKNFEQIKDRVKEMESVLGKIKEIKLKEEAELKGWTEDVDKIKSQLSEIDSGIFDQI
ncbi:MAG: hypothetical protein U9Q73_00720 [Nanoarchaeota archaeon]|nr:hypothetical protein [Nanoarchaeota archaeon]